jgi:hypothetical protein
VEVDRIVVLAALDEELWDVVWWLLVWLGWVVDACAAADPAGILTVCPAKIRSKLWIWEFAVSTAARLALCAEAIPERVSPG